ncbi:MAG: hypothetical protein INR71_14220, partial [Terriglobus roseus]|nr:hypothetical protein [Terriglobus roseus]
MSAGVIADFKGEGADPRLPTYSDENVVSEHYIKPQQRLLHDSNVSFEEYRHYAIKTRADEDVLRAKE